MTYERLVDGEILAAEGRFEAACDCWRLFWEGLEPRIPAGTKRATAMAGLFRGAIVEAWAERYATILARAAEARTTEASAGIAFVESYLATFPQTAGTARWALRAAHGRLLIAAGEEAGGLSLLEALVAECPESPVPVRALLDAVATASNPSSASIARAVSLAESALKSRLDRDGSWGLEGRAKDVRARG